MRRNAVVDWCAGGLHGLAAMTGPRPSWSRHRQWLEECRERFGEILDIPLGEPGYREIVRRLEPATRLLDVGAGKDMVMRQHLTAPGQTYVTLDPDPDGQFDYRSFDEIPDGTRFDLVVSQQVVEHMTMPEAHALIAGARRVLEPGGELVVSVPNVAHPVRYWADPTHVTPWSLGALYCLLRAGGFEVTRIRRLNKYPLTANPLKRFVVRAVCEVFRIDWCDTLLMVAR